MKDIVPETLEEALKVIEKQKLELHEKESEIQKKESELQKKDSELQKQQEEIIKARVEIERLNEQLAIKRAREYAARSEKSSHINSDQKELPFDIENQSLENAVKEESSELYEETEIPVSDKSKSTRKSNAGRKAARLQKIRAEPGRVGEQFLLLLSGKVRREQGGKRSVRHLQYDARCVLSEISIVRRPQDAELPVAEAPFPGPFRDERDCSAAVRKGEYAVPYPDTRGVRPVEEGI